jgi:hypothetical protein
MSCQFPFTFHDWKISGKLENRFVAMNLRIIFHWNGRFILMGCTQVALNVQLNGIVLRDLCLFYFIVQYVIQAVECKM